MHLEHAFRLRDKTTTKSTSSGHKHRRIEPASRSDMETIRNGYHEFSSVVSVLGEYFLGVAGVDGII